MQTFLASYKHRIDTFLTEYLLSRSSDTIQHNKWQKDAYDRLSIFVKNGKSIRGSLFLWAIDRYSGSISNKHVEVASAFELIHSGFLIHDDIMDTDRLRRGHKTMYVQYEVLGNEKNIEHPESFGKNLAICVGDLAIFLGMDCLSAISSETLQSQSICRDFASVCLAQMQDVSFGMNQEIPTVEEVLSMYKYKTARYTISLPLTAGAQIAKAPMEDCKILESIGEDMGLMFQLSDDLLNIFGSSATTGKSVGSDIMEEKKTYAYVTLMNSLSETELLSIRSLTDPTQRAGVIMNYMESYDIRSTVNSLIGALSEKVHTAILKLSLPDTVQGEFIAFSDSLKNRSV